MLQDAKTAKQKTVATSGDILKALEVQKQRRLVNAAQDYLDGVFYYGQRIGGVLCLISSTPEVITFDEARSRGLTPHVNDAQGDRISAEAVERLWAGTASVQPADLHARLVGYIRRFVRLEREAEFDLLALWVMGTYLFRALPAFPYIHLSGEKASGKTTVMEILQPICFNGRISASSTAAVIFRNVHSLSSTLFIDEAERLGQGTNEGQATLIDVLNSGYRKSGTASRMVGDDHSTLMDYSTYSPKMLGAINGLPNVLQDRTIAIHMVRRKSTEKIELYTESRDILSLQRALRDDLYIFGLTHGVTLVSHFNDHRAEIRGLDGIENRSNELWAPLMLISNYTDINGGSASLTAEMHVLAKGLVKDRAADDERENPTTALLSGLRTMLRGEAPIRLENGDDLWPTDTVFDYLQRPEYPSWLRSKTWLTQKLGALGMRNVNKQVAGKAVRCYIVSGETVKDLCERYNVPDLESVTGSVTPKNDESSVSTMISLD